MLKLWHQATVSRSPCYSQMISSKNYRNRGFHPDPVITPHRLPVLSAWLSGKELTVAVHERSTTGGPAVSAAAWAMVLMRW